MISVIIPLYNKKNEIRKTIQSVIKQTFTDWEIVIIDDGSTDGSYNCIADLVECNANIHYHCKVNAGVSAARNDGIKKAIGEWVVYLDADDYMMPCCLSVLFNLVIKYKVQVGTANFYTEYKGKKRKVCIGRNEGIVKNRFLKSYRGDYFIRAGATIYSKDIVTRFPFDETLSRYEDMENSLNIVRNTSIAYSPECVMIYNNDSLYLSTNTSNFNKDFITNITFNEKPFWEKMLLATLVRQAYVIYPNSHQILNESYGRYLIMIKLEGFLYKFIIKTIQRFYRLIMLITDRDHKDSTFSIDK